jgi:F0F1-type ATP synthase assembly protein I
MATALRSVEVSRRWSTSAALFSLTLFVSAALLFLLEPMFAKMTLPVLGGTTAVWATCMLFYQAMLLAGYAFANVLTRLMTYRQQARRVSTSLRPAVTEFSESFHLRLAVC